MSNDFTFRKVELSKMERFRELIKACFSIEVDENYFPWKYLDNPSGHLVAFEALHGETVAGFYGLLPETYLINGVPTKIYQSMDTMTHPQFQKRGLFTKLANLTFEHVMETEGHLDMVGIPGTQSLHGFVSKLQWTNIHSFGYHFVPKALFRAKTLLVRRRPLDIEPVTSMTPGLRTYLQGRKPNANSITPHLSPEFFQWRVFGHPYRGYRVLAIKSRGTMVGLIVYRMPESGRCFITLLDWNDSSYPFAEVVTALEVLFDESQAGLIYTWVPINEKLRTVYEKCAFLHNPFQKGPFSYRVPLIVRSHGKQVAGKDWYDIRNFNLQPIMQD